MQCPPFGGDDLRLVGEMCTDPLTRAMRNDAIAFRGPVWSEGRPGLATLGENLSGALAMVIRTGALSFAKEIIPDS